MVATMYDVKLTWDAAKDPWRGVSVTKVVKRATNGWGDGQGPSKRIDDLQDFLLHLAELCHRYGYNFDVLVAMSALETDYWRNEDWSLRLNPGSIGVGDVKNFYYSWESGEDAAKAMIAHISVYVSGFRADLAKDGILSKNPRYFAVWEAEFDRSVLVIANLGNGRWASDPKYATKVFLRYDYLRALK